MSTLLNSLTVAGETMLLTRTVSGTSTHLTTTKASGNARAAILDRPDRRIDRPEAPNCQKCLAVIDKSFPTPTPDDRIPVLADLAATAVNEHGTAEIVGVPGDQMNALRQAIRAELRQRFGFSTRTFTQDGLPVVSSHETHDLIEQTAARAMAEFDFGGTTKVDDTGWRFHWTTWSMS